MEDGVTLMKSRQSNALALNNTCNASFLHISRRQICGAVWFVVSLVQLLIGMAIMMAGTPGPKRWRVFLWILRFPATSWRLTARETVFLIQQRTTAATSHWQLYHTIVSCHFAEAHWCKGQGSPQHWRGIGKQALYWHSALAYRLSTWNPIARLDDS
jgi:hypothetical protein